MAPDFVSNEEIVIAARKNLGQGPWDYLVGGSESETTLRRNRLAFDRIAFRPRVLVDVSQIDTSTEFMGNKLRIPVLLAPIGSLQAFDPGGGATVAKAAQEFGVTHVVSTATQPGLEDIMEASDAAKIFQLYVRGDDPWVEEIVTRAARLGYQGLAVTVDLAVESYRERPMISRWTRPSRRVPFDRSWQARLDWRKLDWIKGLTNMALQHDVDVIWVSNHGGRQLDAALGSLDTLREVVPAVNGRAKIVVDGGIQRGSDILKAIAMGADAVSIGRLQAWGLAAGGQAGVVRVLELLENEIISAMGLLGVTRLDQLGPEYLREAERVTQPHEMSAWVNMPGYRVL
jgi:glycolate oxidase